MGRSMRVFLATPFGANGTGGIDRLMDLMAAEMGERPNLEIDAVRLVTRGRHGLAHGAFVFSVAMARFWLAANTGRVDLIHINLASGGSTVRKAMLGRCAKRLGIPYVVHLHSGRFDRFWTGAAPRLAAAIDRLFAQSDAIIVLGKYWADMVASRVPSASTKVVVLPNATAPQTCDREPAGNGQVRITFLGKLGPNKGTPLLLEALARLRGRNDWTATIAGNGAVKDGRAFAAGLGIAERVSFPGWLDGLSVAKQLSQTDIFVLPSLSEGLPMAILEAFAWGIPVIATPVGCVPEVVEHDRNGLIVPVGDIGGLAQALQRLIQDPMLRRTLGNMARQDHATRFDINVYAPRLAAIWRNAAPTSGAEPMIRETAKDFLQMRELSLHK
jgi:glycosyltransferase involved in cell wall biosynthesis